MRYFKAILFSFTFIFFINFSSPVTTEGQLKVSAIEQEDRDMARQLFLDGLYFEARPQSEYYLKTYPGGIFRAEVMFILAQVEMKEKKYVRATKLLEEIIEKYESSPYSEDAYYLAGALFAQIGEDKKAEQYFSLLVKKFPQTKFIKKTLWFRGKIAYKNKNWKKAEKLFKQTLNLRSLSSNQKLEGKYLLSWSLHFQGKTNEAQNWFKKLSEQNLTLPQKAAIAFQLGVYARDRKDFIRAINFFKKQQELWSKSDYQAQSTFWIAESYYLIYQDTPKKINLEQKKEAISYYSKNISFAKPVKLTRSRYHRGWLLMDLKKEKEALTDFNWLQKNNKKYAADLDLSWLRSQLYQKRNKFRLANKVLFSALLIQKKETDLVEINLQILRNLNQLNDCSALTRLGEGLKTKGYKKYQNDIQTMMGECYYQAKNWGKAKKSYSMVSPKYQLAPLFFERKIESYVKSNDIKGAVKLINSVEGDQRFGKPRHLSRQKFNLLSKLKNWDQALVVLKELEKTDPGFRSDYHSLLLVADTNEKVASTKTKKKKYYLEAINYYEKSLSLVDKNNKNERLAILQSQADLYQKLGDSKKMIKSFLASLPLIENKEKKEKILIFVAGVYQKEKNWDEAFKINSRVYRNYPARRKDWSFLKNLGDLKSKLGDKEKAVQFYELSLPLIPPDKKEEKLRLIDILAGSYESKDELNRLIKIYSSSLPFIVDKKKKEETRLYIARLAIKLKDWKLAIDNLKIVLKNSKKRDQDFALLYLLAQAYEGDNNPGKAFVYYSKSYKAQPVGISKLKLNLFDYLAKELNKRGKFQELEKHYSSSLTWLKDSTRRKTVIQGILAIQLRLNKWIESLGTIQELQKEFPEEQKNIALLFNRARIYKKLSAHTKMIQQYEEILPLLNDSESKQKLFIISILGNEYQAKQKYRKMLNLYEKSIPLLKDEKKKTAMIILIGKTWYSKLGSPQKAVNWFDKLHLKGKTENHFEASVLIAEIKIAQKKVDQAIKKLEDLDRQRISSSSRWYLPSHYRLAELYRLKGKWKKALRQYQFVTKALGSDRRIEEAKKMKKKIILYLRSRQKNAS